MEYPNWGEHGPKPSLGSGAEQPAGFQSLRRTRPMQTNFFRHVALFHAHFSPDPIRSHYSQFLPENLRPGNLDNYIAGAEKPQLFGNNFWWVSQGLPEPGILSGEDIRTYGCATTENNQKGTCTELHLPNSMEVENLSNEEVTVKAKSSSSLCKGQFGSDSSLALVNETKGSDVAESKDKLYYDSVGVDNHPVSNAINIGNCSERVKGGSCRFSCEGKKGSDANPVQFVDGSIQKHLSSANGDVNDAGHVNIRAETAGDTIDVLGIESFLMNENENTGNNQLNTENGTFVIPSAFADLLNIDDFMEGLELNHSPRVLPATEGIMVQETGPKSLHQSLKENGTVSEVAVSHLGVLEEGEIPNEVGVDHSSIDMVIVDVATAKGDLSGGHVHEYASNKEDFKSDQQEAGQEKEPSQMDCLLNKIKSNDEALRVGVEEKDGCKKGRKLELVGKSRAGKYKKSLSTKDRKLVVGVKEDLKKTKHHDADLLCDRIGQSIHEKEGNGITSLQKYQQSELKSKRYVRFSRDQLLLLRRVDAVPADILKIRQETEAELLGNNQKMEHGATSVDSCCKKRKWAPVSMDKIAEQKVASIVTNENFPSGKRQKSILDETSKKEVDISKKKKRGPISEEKKAKRKKKEKLKRAEKNRKLGVKRLKIQTIVKPKTVVHCRHYLKGRCHEGEKCKFSHDVVPLTKSTPCSHFARQSCMKGDDCPFDHELSKYQCNNFVNTGFCSRGDSCFFSHKVPPKADITASNGTSEFNAKSPVPSNSADPKKRVDSVPPSSSSAKATPNNAKDLVGVGVMNKPSQVPKGVSFVSFDPDKSNLHKQPPLLSQKTDSGFGTTTQQDQSTTNRMLNSGEISRGTPPAGWAKPTSYDASDNFEHNKLINIGGPHSSDIVKDNTGPSFDVKTPKGLSFVSFGSGNREEFARQNKEGFFQKGNNVHGGVEAVGCSQKTEETFKSTAQPVMMPPAVGLFSVGYASVEHKDSGDSKRQARMSLLGNSNVNTSAGNKGSVDERPKMNVSLPLQSALAVASPGSSDRSSSGLDNNPLVVKATTNSGLRSLQSTLAFAAKYDSGGSRMNPSMSNLGGASESVTQQTETQAITKSSNDSGGASGSASKQQTNLVNKASLIWEILYGGGNKT